MSSLRALHAFRGALAHDLVYGSQLLGLLLVEVERVPRPGQVPFALLAPVDPAEAPLVPRLAHRLDLLVGVLDARREGPLQRLLLALAELVAARLRLDDGLLDLAVQLAERREPPRHLLGTFAHDGRRVVLALARPFGGVQPRVALVLLDAQQRLGLLDLLARASRRAS